jgi:CheY-like chemotaxis protein
MDDPFSGQAAPDILIADDSRTSQEFLRGMLLRLGHEANIVSNGLDAVAAARRRTYKLIFMDIMMPGLDGLAACIEIRKIPGKRGKVPIIALTAVPFLQRELSSFGGRFNEILIKPIQVASLVALLTDLGIRSAPDPHG